MANPSIQGIYLTTGSYIPVAPAVKGIYLITSSALVNPSSSLLGAIYIGTSNDGAAYINPVIDYTNDSYPKVQAIDIISVGGDNSGSYYNLNALPWGWQKAVLYTQSAIIGKSYVWFGAFANGSVWVE